MALVASGRGTVVACDGELVWSEGSCVDLVRWLHGEAGLRSAMRGSLGGGRIWYDSGGPTFGV